MIFDKHLQINRGYGRKSVKMKCACASLRKIGIEEDERDEARFALGRVRGKAGTGPWPDLQKMSTLVTLAATRACTRSIYSPVYVHTYYVCVHKALGDSLFHRPCVGLGGKKADCPSDSLRVNWSYIKKRRRQRTFSNILESLFLVYLWKYETGNWMLSIGGWEIREHFANWCNLYFFFQLILEISI